MGTSNLNETFWNKGSPLVINDTGHAHGYKGKIYFVGGSAVQKYDPSEEEWTIINEKGLGYSPYRGGSDLIDDRIYMVHGWTDRNTTYYDISSNSFGTFPHPETIRLDVGVAALDGILYVSGGWVTGGSAVSTVEAYNPKNNGWSTVKSMNQARKDHEMVAAGGFLYVIAGKIGSGFTTKTNTVEKYNPSTDEWDYIEEVPIKYKECGSTKTHDQSIIITNNRYTHVYNTTENKWIQGPRFKQPSNINYYANSLAWCGGKVYSIGLRDAPGNYYNTVWIAKISEPIITEDTSDRIPGFTIISLLINLIILIIFLKKQFCK